MTIQPTSSSLQQKSLRQFLESLGELWLITESVTALLSTCEGTIPDRGQINRVEIVPQADCVLEDNLASIGHALHLGFDESLITRAGEAPIVCCHSPVSGHVLVYDMTKKVEGRCGTLTICNIAQGFPPQSVFARVTLFSLFTVKF